MKRPVIERAWDRIERGLPDECWRFRGTHAGTNRDRPYIDKQPVARILLGLVPGDGLNARHTCDTPWCVNPRHLLSGTSEDNHRDMVDRGRSNFGERHWNAKVTAEQVAAIRADPRAHGVIATEYGIQRRQVSRIKQRARWREVTPASC